MYSEDEFYKTLSKLLPTLDDKQVLLLYASVKRERSRRRLASKVAKKRQKFWSFALTARNFSDYKADVILRNMDELLSIPTIASPSHDNEKYFESLMGQDWGHIYTDSEDRGDYYVYAHVNPELRAVRLGGTYGFMVNGTPFYIGKGSGDRAYNLKRNQGHGKQLRQLQKSGWGNDEIVHIIYDCLSEAKAYEMESKLIYFYGTKYQKGRPNGALYNLDTPEIPEFHAPMYKLMFKKQFARCREGNL